MKGGIKLERIQITVSKDRKYIIPKKWEKYGLKPGKKITFETDEKNRVIGKIH